jgi:hypothetical protein
MWLLSLVAIAAFGVAVPQPVGATTFSFGDIDATDQIRTITLNSNSDGLSYDSVNDRLTVSAWITEISFWNKPDFTGITPNTIQLTAILDQVSAIFIPTTGFVLSVNALFASPAVDYSIVDMVTIQLMVEGNFDAGLGLSVGPPNLSLINGNFAGDMSNANMTGGDSDFRSAWGTTASLGGTQVIGIGSALCGTLVTCGPVEASINDFDAPAALVINTSNIPEPGTALLVAVGLFIVSARRKRTT